MACQDPETVAAHCGPNAKNIKPRIWLANPEKVDVIPAATDGVITDDITMVVEDPVNVFAVWPISKVDPGFTGEPEGDIDGLEIPIVVTGFIPKMEGAKSAKLNKSIGGEHIVILEDKNGVKWLIGALNDGAFVKVGVQTNDKNGYPITIEWTTANLPYEYQGVIPI